MTTNRNYIYLKHTIKGKAISPLQKVLCQTRKKSDWTEKVISQNEDLKYNHLSLTP